MPAAAFQSSDFNLDPRAAQAAPNPLQSFGRFEFKYIVPARVRLLLEQELRAFMEIDPFCRDRPGQSYTVRSLYFDDSGFHDYYAKIDGHLNREKYRLRSYDAPGTAPCFLEIKGKQNHFSYKYRTPLDTATRALVDRQRWSSLLTLGDSSPVIRRFAAVACRRHLQPQVVVEYSRRPYVGRRDYRFRVTFDGDLRAARGPDLDRGSRPTLAFLRDQSVLEIKFESSLPVWFQRLLGTYELQRISISKYCRAAEALTVVSNLE